MITYQHTQAGTLARWSIGIPALLLTLSLVLGRAQPPVTIVALAILLACLLLFHSLTTAVTSDALVVAFGPGWIRRSIPLRAIRCARVVRNPWWYGWGIRLTLNGWLWNVSGLDAVELKFESGAKFRIGTDEPQRLKTAIEQAGRSSVCHLPDS